jgi:hypothetical protein
MSAKADPAAAGWGSVIRDIFGGWDRFWFSRMDPTTLGFIRLCCGLLTFYIHLTYSFGLFSYVGKDAWIDNEVATYLMRDVPFWGLENGWDGNYVELGKGNYYWSIYYHVTDPTWVVAIHVFFLVNMLAFALGLGTRYTGAITWLGAMSYVHRANSTVFGVDTMMMILLLYLQIGPSGATLSLDRLIQKWLARRAGLPIPEVQPSYAANFAIRLMQVHFCIVYLASGTSKLLGSTWWSGTSLNLVMLNASFAPMDKAPYMWVMRTMAKHRWLWETFMSFSIIFSVLLETCFAFLIWDRRWRWPLICASVMLHLGIGVFMGLVTFSLMMMIFVCSFIPPEIVQRMTINVQGWCDRLFKGKPPGVKQTTAGELVMSR